MNNTLNDGTEQMLGQRLAQFWVESKQIDLRARLGKPLAILAAMLILILAVPAFPPLRDRVLASWPDNILLASMRESWATWQDWLPFVSLLLELGLAVFVGGSIYGQLITDKSQEIMNAAGKRIESRTGDKADKLRADLISRINSYEEKVRTLTPKTFIAAIPKLYSDSMAIYKTLSKSSSANARFLAAKTAIAFPGGLYGLLAFILFWTSAFLKVLSSYHQALNPA